MDHLPENPIAAAPSTAARWPAWVASVTAGITVLVVTSLWFWMAGRLVNAVDRDTCNAAAAAAVDQHRHEVDRTLADQHRRLTDAEQQARANHGVLIELRTKVDLILQRLKD